MGSCPACGAEDLIEYDSAAGNAVCTNCGFVSEENTIVAEVTFGEASSGAAFVQGSHVGAGQTRARIGGARGRYNTVESRELAQRNGLKHINAVAITLRLPDRFPELAQRYYNLAINTGFVQGRRTEYVAAACLYVVARMDKSSHMLIDFSDVLEINVFVLGSTYLKLVRELSLQNIPLIDPSVYISRFAALLEFGEETQKVAQDAVRLVKRFDRDWMQTGRRPSGICGACLMLAARMNNFRRSVQEIVQVVKIADVTLRKRLEEFKGTASGQLTVESFRSIWLEEYADPPAFVEGKKKDKKAKEDRFQQGKESGKAGGGKGDQGEDGGEGGEEVEGEKSGAEDAPEGPVDEPTDTPSEEVSRKRKATDDEPEDVGEFLDPLEGTSVLDVPALDDAVDQGLADEVSNILASGEGQVLSDALTDAEVRRLQAAQQDSLDDLDEEELDYFILDEDEVKNKTRVWMETNLDYLENVAAKRLQEENGERPKQRAPRQRKKQKARDSSTAQGATAAESTKQMMQKRKFSKKINYAVIDSLFDDDAQSNANGSRVASPALSRVSEEGAADESLFRDETASDVGSVVDGYEGGSRRTNMEEGLMDTVEEEDEEPMQVEPEHPADPEDDWRRHFNRGGEDEEEDYDDAQEYD